MNGETKPAKKTIANTSKSIPRISSGLLLIATIIAIAGRSHLPWTDGVGDTIILMLAFAATLTSLGSQLPAQNIALATIVIAFIGSAIQTLNTFSGIPFGPLLYKPESGPRLFNGLLWFFPLWWVIAVLASRGVARLILRPWRKIRVYGFWLMGITTLLAILLELGLQPFATRVRHYWIWSPSKLAVDWYGTPLSDFLGWLVTILLALAFATPALMKKKPTKSGPDYHPLVIWITLNVLFVAGAFAQHLFAATAVSAAVCLIIIPFAIRGARW